MKHLVLESFTYARDGYMPRLLKAGRRYEINAEHVARFTAEGRIEAPASDAHAPARAAKRARKPK